MKKINILITAVLFWVLSSCQSFLEPVPPINIPIDAAYTSAESVQNGLIGVYASMQKSYYYGGYYLLVGEGLSDNSSTGGYDNPVIDEIGGKAVTPSNTLVGNMWVAIYNTIAHTNHLLKGVEGVSMDGTEKAQVIAQARAVRALAHFDLLRYFGAHWDINSKYGVPVIDSPVGIDVKPSRKTVSETYTFIISELTAALATVGDNSSANFIGKDAIKALLARVYLYKGDKVNASKYATEVINSGKYHFLDTPAKIYNTKTSSESIFELYFDQQSQSSYNGYTYAREDALRSEVLFLASGNLNSFFKARPTDPRGGLLDYSTDTNNPSITESGDGRTQKFRGETTKDNPAYIVRLAEMYLIKAEADNSVAPINVLRKARGVDALKTLTGDALTNAILDERRAELNFEGHRFFDLVRLKKYTSMFGLEAYKVVLPIPTNEILASDNNLVQYPGYDN